MVNKPISELEIGDIVQFKKTYNGPTKSVWQNGVVIARPLKRQGKIDGVSILPISSLPPSVPFKRNPREFLYDQRDYHQDTKKLMGLSTNQNWVLKYVASFLPNLPQYTGIRKGGNVRVIGSVSKDQSISKILYHAEALDIVMPTGANLDQETRKALALQSGVALSDISRVAGGEAGKKTHREIERQDAGADSYDDMGRPPTDLPFKKPNNKIIPNSNAREMNISIDDARKLDFINQRLYQTLKLIRNEDGQVIKTLKEAKELAAKNKDLLTDSFERAADITISEAYKKGILPLTPDEYEKLTASFTDKRRKNNDTDPTLVSVRNKIFTNGKEAQKILSRFQNEDEALDVVDAIEEAYDNILLESTANKPSKPRALESRLNTAWSKFANEAVNNRSRIENAGVQFMYPKYSR